MLPKWVYAHALDPGDWHDGELISLTEVRHVHRLTMEPVWSVSPHDETSARETPGNFREHDIEPFPAGMTPPPWPLVPTAMQAWAQEVADLEPGLRSAGLSTPLPETLASVHNGFERIHPFLDGNGRTGRLLLNLVLVRLGHPPVVIFKRQRDSYLSALQRADEDDFGPLGEILARAMYDNLTRFIVPSVAGLARIVPIASLVDRQFSLAALRQAAQRGRLAATQGPDGVWRSSRSAVEDYQRTKNRRRPAPGKECG